MRKIGLISDSHGLLDSATLEYLKPCDEIWHAGDIGDIALLEQLREWETVRFVRGNIDGPEFKNLVPDVLKFQVEDVPVFMTHIGGYPGRYATGILKQLKEYSPQLFICGHSHILKVMYDKKNQWLHMNPGAVGKFGFHKVRTLLRFDIDGAQIQNLEVIEMPRKE